MPTFAQVAEIEIPEQSNGISILPLLKGESQMKHDHLNWEFQLDGWGRKMPKGGFRQSVRIDNWKGVRYGINTEQNFTILMWIFQNPTMLPMIIMK